MRSSVNTGEECPGGRAVFQTTFFAGPNSSGRLLVSAIPEPFGPRNWGQSSAAAIVASKVASKQARGSTVENNDISKRE